MPSVEVQGTDRLIERLKGFEKETYRILQQEVREGMSAIAVDAQQATPDRALRKWGAWNADNGASGGFRNTTRDRPFEGAAVRGSIKPGFRTRKGAGGALGVRGIVTMASPAGAIFALAGKRNPDAFGGHIARKYGNSGPWPRLLGPAWHANVDKVRDEIRAAVYRAAEKVN